jgi:hypothetical protein
MAFVHSKNTVVKLNAVDLSTFTDSTDFNDGVDTEDITTYGPTRTRKSYGASLGDGTISLKGTYDDGVSGPAKTIQPLMDAGAPVTFLFQPKGAGTGKPQQSVSVIITAFNVSSPVAGYCKWTAELQMTGDITRTDQA